VHRKTTRRFLRLMSETLKRDICGLQMPGTLTNDIKRDTVELCLPRHVQDACCCWIDHLLGVSHHQWARIDLNDCGQVHEFFREHFLHWLEALGLMRKMSEGVRMLKGLQSMINVGILI
jgi:hypothetical protein